MLVSITWSCGMLVDKRTENYALRIIPAVHERSSALRPLRVRGHPRHIRQAAPAGLLFIEIFVLMCGATG